MDNLDRLTFYNAVQKGLRLCLVDGKCGWFHCWENYAEVIEPGITIGSSQGGQISMVYGIVEFNDGVKRILPGKIKFVDDINSVLNRVEDEAKSKMQEGN